MVNPPYEVDLLPPVITSATTIDEYRVMFVFDEQVQALTENLLVQPELPVASVSDEGNRILITFAEAQEIGETYVMEMEAGDTAGNTLGFIFEFTGWNPDVPTVLVNELNPRGSGNTPDCIELLAAEDGNLGGMRLLVGTPNEYSGELVFPSLEVAEGDFILVHPKSEGIVEETDELTSKDESGGLLATDTAWDFWIPGSPGLPGNNGAVTLYNRKGGELVDAILWSDRTWDPEDDRLGWTSDGYAFALDLAADNAWDSEGSIPTPSEAVDVSRSTATRSLCRGSQPEDTDSAADWHTVPTSGRTFGESNLDAVYEP